MLSAAPRRLALLLVAMIMLSALVVNDQKAGTLRIHRQPQHPFHDRRELLRRHARVDPHLRARSGRLVIRSLLERRRRSQVHDRHPGWRGGRRDRGRSRHSVTAPPSCVEDQEIREGEGGSGKCSLFLSLFLLQSARFAAPTDCFVCVWEEDPDFRLG